MTGIALNKSTTSIAENATETLTATLTPSNTTYDEVTWVSSDTSVATVDDDGEVTGVSAATATITAITERGGFTASCVVTVTE